MALAAYIDKSWIGYTFAVAIIILGVVGQFVLLPFNPMAVAFIMNVIYALLFKKSDNQ